MQMGGPVVHVCGPRGCRVSHTFNACWPLAAAFQQTEQVELATEPVGERNHSVLLFS